MSAVSTAIVTLLVAMVVVFCVALIIYLSSLVKNAYQIKVEMRGELDDGMKKIDEELNKRSRWIKRELLEEIEKVKVAMHTDNARRFGEMNDLMRKSVNEMLEGEKKERHEINKRLEGIKESQGKHDQVVKRLKRDVRRLGDDWDADADPDAEDEIDLGADGLPKFPLNKPDIKEEPGKDAPKEAGKKTDKKNKPETPALSAKSLEKPGGVASSPLPSFPLEGLPAPNKPSNDSPPQVKANA